MRFLSNVSEQYWRQYWKFTGDMVSFKSTVQAVIFEDFMTELAKYVVRALAHS